MGKEDKIEGQFAVVAAIIVLFSAMLDPVVSVMISIAALVGFSIYKLRSRP